MLQLQHRRHAAAPAANSPAAPETGAPAAPAGRPVANVSSLLGVSWLNSLLQVVVMQQGQPTAQWSSPLSPDDVRDLGDLLREAVKQTGFTGHTVALVLAHPLFVQQFIDAPPAKGAALDAYIQRQVDQQKGADGALSWVAQPRLPSKTGKGFLLSLLPESFLDQLKKECQRAGLRLKVLVPVTALLQERLPDLPRNGTEVVLVAAETNGLTSLLVARPDGEVLVGRSVAGGWSQQADRVAMDIKRTSLFASQQLGQPVSSIWLLAPPPAEHVRRMQDELGIPVLPFPQEVTPTFWAEAVTRWPADKAPNFIPHEPEVAPRQHLLNRVVLTVAAGAAVSALAATLFLEYNTRQEARGLGRLRAQTVELQSRHLELQRLTGDVVRRRQAIRELKDNRLPPVPAWFLGQLGESSQRNLLLTSGQIRRDGEEWRFQVAGRLIPARGTNTVDPGALPRSVKEFAARLANGPLRARVREQPGTVPPPKAETGGTAFTRWAQSKGLNLAAQAADQRFVLEGTLQ